MKVFCMFCQISHPFPSSKEFRRVFEIKVFCLKLAWEEEAKVFLKRWVQLSKAEFAFRYQEKKSSFYKRQ